jgi:hypothetical protein
MKLRPGQFACRLSVWVTSAWLTCAAPVWAQDTATPKANATTAPAAPSAEKVLSGEILPKLFLLKDKDGKLQAMPGIAFEEFMETWKAKNQLGQQQAKPSFSIEKLRLEGSASRERAELTAHFTFTVLDAGWVGVPLRLNNSVVRDPSFEGPGEHVLRFDPERDGYVVWVRAETGTSHQLRLKLLAAVVQMGAESHLRLNCPRAAVSQLGLEVPLEHALAKVSEGSTLEPPKPLENGHSRLLVEGLGGEVDLAWHAAEVQLAALPTVLEATGTLFVRINGRSIDSEAKLVVRSLGGEFDRFQLRLPPAARYVGTPPPGMTLTRQEEDGPQGALYEVKLDKESIGPLEVPLHTERTIGAAPAGTQTDELLELGGFEVVGAVRQSGSIAVKLEGNWQVVWGESNQVSQVEDLASIPRRDDLTAAFEYFAQPYSLTARVVPQRTRIRVQGEYVVLVGSEAVQLAAKLKYTIRGAKVRSLDVDLPGWEVDVVGPSSLVNVDAIAAQGDSLPIPLLQAVSGEVELTLEAHQKIAPDDGVVVLDLPRPRAETVAPANVAVVPADNIELTFDAERAIAIAPQTALPQMTLPDRLQDPLFFRTDATAARFAGTVKVHEQSISTSINTQLNLDETETQVDERIAFRIAYEPADHLTLGVPRSIRPDRLTIMLDGQRLSPTPVRERAGETNDVVPMRLPLPSPRIGRCELQVRYVARHEKPLSAASISVSVPLVVPGEGQLTTNELVVVPQNGIAVDYVPGPWSENAPAESPESAGSLALSARRALSEVALAVNFIGQPAAGGTTIERGWIQTVLTDTERHDRAVFRFLTSQPRLQLTIPNGADVGSLAAEIDGRRVAPESVRQRELTFAVPGGGGEHALDLRYHFTQRPSAGSLTLAPVQIKSADWIEQLYWQLILPAREHVLFAPGGFTREYRWTWSNYFWQREPIWEQRELENWTGAVPATQGMRLPNESPEQFAARQQTAAQSTNRYLFSTLGTVAPLEFYTLSRARLVLWASLPLLLTGLLLIYFPATRHPGVLFALAVVVAAGALIEPESALLLAQSSSLGLVLAAAAALLARAASQPVAVSVSSHGSSKAHVERGVTEIYHRAATHGLQPSTATEPAVSTSAPEEDS